MSLQNIVHKVFSERDGSIDKPSFTGHEIMCAEGEFALVVLPQQLRSMRMRRPRASGYCGEKDFSVLASVEGYFVGGMSQKECVCGKESIFVQCGEQSKEPGREQRKLFDELGLSYDASSYDAVQSSGAYRFRRSGMPSEIGFCAEEKPFFKNRTYEVWTVASAERAQRYRGAFDRVLSVKPDAKFHSLPIPEGVFCMLTASYVMLRPGQERDAAQKLILGTFG